MPHYYTMVGCLSTFLKELVLFFFPLISKNMQKLEHLLVSFLSIYIRR